MNKFYLFSYGTLMDIEIQKILFSREINMIDATLENHSVYADSDGYYYVKEKAGQSIQGKVLELTQEEIWIADQWEEIPKYLRENIKIRLNDGSYKEVFIYIKTNVKSEIQVKPNEVSNYSIDEVIQIAGDFKKQLNDITIP
ncbi:MULTISPECIES: gamma-glutamylcyclotransferase family protein [unclassified Clostridium]|uniref:gamma-glutamylcyclotransferase family protein n=1 Tax=unclassified Clostridium TaxID=2614128 RepID=UPI0002978AB0|nr:MULTISPECIES: gamma-glutamylcyclotransferase family protein [unclassified Clostridium]EKQ54541.1 MAG: AIG2-like family protein [Clostridium sp. Maddingley MBC34-26]